MLLIDMVETQLFIPGLIQGYQQWRANRRSSTNLSFMAVTMINSG